MNFGYAMMKKTSLVFLLASAFVIRVCAGEQKSSPSAQDLLHSAINAMGGEAALRGIRSVQFKALEQRNALEQSERPEGPYVVESSEISEARDFAGGRWRRAIKSQFAWMKASQVTIMADGVAAKSVDEHFMPGAPQDLVDAEEALELSPEHILLTAQGSSDLRPMPDTVIHAVREQVLQFTWKNLPVTIFLNADTHLPTAVEWMRAYPHDMFWSVWGDVTTRVHYSFWWLTPGGIHYPLQLDVVRNGLPDRTITISELRINEVPDDNSFTIPADVQSTFKTHPTLAPHERPLPATNAQELAPGIVFFRGAWNTTIVEQGDGIVVLEAPMSSGYSAQVIQEAEKRYPGKRINAVISTSDSWPHIGGVREYVAAGIPVYVLDRTEPLLKRLVGAPRAEFPDALAKSPRQATFISVSGKTSIGSGPNRIEIYPIHGQTTERQMMVYFPEQKLLYGSDAFQKTPDGQYFYPQTMLEVRDAVAREHLTVERFFMMHMGVTPWRDVLEAHGGNIPSS